MTGVDGDLLLDPRRAGVGAPLARQEMVTAFGRLLDRLGDIRLDGGHDGDGQGGDECGGGPPERSEGLLLYSFKALPIRFT